ncbi:MAG: hypothetical protein LBS01_09045 [Prevotellaceae bacterium]|nr:hypothetical protein [Prevotellaceae bacterium]
MPLRKKCFVSAESRKTTKFIERFKQREQRQNVILSEKRNILFGYAESRKTTKLIEHFAPAKI